MNNTMRPVPVAVVDMFPDRRVRIIVERGRAPRTEYETVFLRPEDSVQEIARKFRWLADFIDPPVHNSPKPVPIRTQSEHHATSQAQQDVPGDRGGPAHDGSEAKVQGVHGNPGSHLRLVSVSPAHQMTKLIYQLVALLTANPDMQATFTTTMREYYASVSED